METYRITNLRGRRDNTGNKAKQMTKQARAPRLQAPKMSKRSHRLTGKQYYVSVADAEEAANTTPPPSKPLAHMANRDMANRLGSMLAAGELELNLEQQLRWKAHWEAMTHASQSLPLLLSYWERARARRLPRSLGVERSCCSQTG